MSTPVDHDPAIDDTAARLRAALVRLAEAYVLDDVEQQGRWSWWSRRSAALVASVLLIVAGGVGLTWLANADDDQPASVTQPNGSAVNGSTTVVATDQSHMSTPPGPPGAVQPLHASDEAFQRAGEDILAEKRKHPELLSQFQPFITDPIDITEPGEYRVPLNLPPGTNTHDLSFMGPGDIDRYFSYGRIGFEPEGVVSDGVAFFVINVLTVAVPYSDFQVWIQ